MLIFGQKISAHEALERNLVNRVVSADSSAAEFQDIVDYVLRLPSDPLRLNKSLLRSVHKQALLLFNENEVNLLKQRWMSKECTDAINNFLQKSETKL